MNLPRTQEGGSPHLRLVHTDNDRMAGRGSRSAAEMQDRLCEASDPSQSRQAYDVSNFVVGQVVFVWTFVAILATPLFLLLFGR